MDPDCRQADELGRQVPRARRVRIFAAVSVGLMSAGLLSCPGCGWFRATPVATPLVQDASLTESNAETVDPCEDSAAVGTVGASALVESGSSAALAASDSASSDPDPDSTQRIGTAAAAADEFPPEPREPEPARERILVFTSAGPLVVEMTLSINGKPFHFAMERLVDEFLAAADTDHDGIVRWDEIFASPRVKFGQYGNMAITSAMQQQDAKRTYDLNSNGRCDRPEVVRFLTQAAGSRAFSLESPNQFRNEARAQSGVRRLLDQDDDRVLTEQELDGAAARLRSRDADEDDILVAEDFLPTDNLAPGRPRPAQNNRSAPRAATRLGGRIYADEWLDAVYSLQQLYASGGVLTEHSFGLTPTLFSQLDRDGDGELAEAELRALAEVAPHISLGVDFGRLRDGNAEHLRLLAMSDDLESTHPTILQESDRITFAWPGLNLILEARDLLGAPDGASAGDVARQQFEQLDTNKNGYLEEDEVSENRVGFLGVPFEGADADGDGKVYPSEFSSLLSARQAAASSQIRVEAQLDGDPMFSALDANGDGRLTAREIDAVRASIGKLDKNHDHELALNELPESIVVIINHGVQNGVVGVPRANRARKQNASIPEWFQRMDTNNDGELSPREFLGTSAKFRQLDANADGYLDPDEIRSLSSPQATPDP